MNKIAQRHITAGTLGIFFLDKNQKSCNNAIYGGL
jgi:hypothetical protein